MDRRRRRVLGILIALAVLLAGSALFLVSADREASPPDGGAVPTPTDGPFAEVDEGLENLVEERATWQTPTSLAVGKSHRIGLVIGDSGRLRTRIDELIEEAVPREASPVKIGPNVRVALWVDAGDATVKPSEAVDQSTGSQIAMLWTWFVRPLRPADRMSFTAHVEVPAEGHTFSTDIPLSVPVERTVSYTAQQIFTNWATWSAIVVAVATGGRWLWKRRRGKQPEESTEA